MSEWAVSSRNQGHQNNISTQHSPTTCLLLLTLKGDSVATLDMTKLSFTEGSNKMPFDTPFSFFFFHLVCFQCLIKVSRLSVTQSQAPNSRRYSGIHTVAPFFSSSQPLSRADCTPQYAHPSSVSPQSHPIFCFFALLCFFHFWTNHLCCNQCSSKSYSHDVHSDVND